jgi:hypothetical protein
MPLFFSLFVVVLHPLNIFVNLFGRAGALNGQIAPLLTSLGFLSSEQGSLVVRARSLRLLVDNHFPIRWEIPKKCIIITSRSPPARKIVQYSDYLNDDQMLLIVNRIRHFDFSLPGSISCFSLIFREFLFASSVV